MHPARLFAAVHVLVAVVCMHGSMHDSMHCIRALSLLKHAKVREQHPMPVHMAWVGVQVLQVVQTPAGLPGPVPAGQVQAREVYHRCMCHRNGVGVHQQARL